MTGAVHPTDFRPVVALFCTRGMEDFLSNAIKGILQTGVEARQVHVGCPLNAQRSVKSVARSYSSDIRVISSQELSGNAGEMTEVFPLRIAFIYRYLMEEDTFPSAIDRDSSACGLCGPGRFLDEEFASVSYSGGHGLSNRCPDRRVASIPPALCLGFVSLARTETTIAFLDALIALRSTQPGGDAASTIRLPANSSSKTTPHGCAICISCPKGCS